MIIQGSFDLDNSEGPTIERGNSTELRLTGCVDGPMRLEIYTGPDTHNPPTKLVIGCDFSWQEAIAFAHTILAIQKAGKIWEKMGNA